MINTDEDALICDLAETYGIFDYRSLPIRTVATFSVGLRANSRILMKMNNIDMDPQLYLLSGMLDRLSILVWQRTKNGMDGVNPPTLILDTLEARRDSVVFDTKEAYEEFRNKVMKGEL